MNIYLGYLDPANSSGSKNKKQEKKGNTYGPKPGLVDKLQSSENLY